MNEAIKKDAENRELSMDDLEKVAGGAGYGEILGKSNYKCSKCGSSNTYDFDLGPGRQMRVYCEDCGYIGLRK